MDDFELALKETRFLVPKGKTELFRDHYKRNNKKNGQKNIRCYPSCPRMHNPFGFCGSGVHVAFVGVYTDPKDILVLSRFELVDYQQDSIPFHSIIDVTELPLKTNENYLAPWHIGLYQQTSTDYGLVYELNGDRQSWHYGWSSNRTLNQITYHHLTVYFFHKQGNTYQCIDKLASTPFLLGSSRSRGTKTKVKRGAMDIVRQKAKIQQPIAITPDPVGLNHDVNSRHKLKDRAKILGIVIISILNLDDFIVDQWASQDYSIDALFVTLKALPVEAFCLSLSDENTTSSSVQQISRDLAEYMIHHSAIFVKIQEFFLKYQEIELTPYLVDRAYCELVHLVQAQVDLFLSRYNFRLDQLYTAYAKENMCLEMEEILNDAVEPCGYALFSSLLMDAAVKTKTFKQGVVNPAIYALPDENLSLLTGYWSCNEAKTKRLILPKTFGRFERAVFHIFHKVFRRYSIRLTDDELQLQSELTIVKSSWAHRKLDGKANSASDFPTGTHLGLKDYSLDYRAWKTDHQTIILENYIWPKPNSKLPRMKSTREYAIQNDRLNVVAALYIDTNPHDVFLGNNPAEFEPEIRLFGFNYNWCEATTGLYVYDRKDDTILKFLLSL